mgnify:FL=1
MKLIVIRHGQTNYNVKHWCNSRPNPKVRLTALGRQQAKAAAEKLKAEKIEVVYISQLVRSQQTALILNGYHHVPVIVDKRLNDRSVGCEDQPVDIFYTWRDKQKNPWTGRFRDGESYEDMKKRIASFLKDLSKMDYKTVLIVTHLPILKAMRGYFKGLSNEQMDALSEAQVPNCRIMRFILPSKTSKKFLKS